MAEEEAVQEATPDEAIDPISLFPEDIRKAVEGLTYLGQLTDTVSFCGHEFGLRTLRPQHHFAIGQVLQPYRDTIVEVNVFQTATVAMALTSVDGDEDWCPAIGPDLESHVRARLAKISHPETGWYAPTIEYLWEQYQILEATSTRAIYELQSLSQGSQPTTSSPWLGSLSAPGPSEDVTSGGIQPSIPSS